MRISVSPHLYQHLLLSDFLVIAILVVWDVLSLWFWFAFPWWLMMLSILLSIFSCAYWPFVYLLSRNVCFNPWLIFIALFIFLLLNCVSSLYILVTNHLIRYTWANIFSCSVNYLFIFLVVCFEVSSYCSLFLKYFIFKIM